MNRKNFISKALLGTATAVVGSSILKAEDQSSKKELLKPVGFNHLPNKEERTMKTVLHKAETRGHANHGWLDSHHTFSFANYYNPERVHFGVLRVLNDDIVAPSRGFGTHPHDNMEIVSIPLSGDLKHKDSMGNEAIIREGDVQVMSAGTGIFHSEFNANDDKEVRFLQIWVFPNKKNVEPRYDQISIRDVEKKNEFYQVLSPNKDDQGVWVHQDAWFNLGKFDKGVETEYCLNKADNGVYAFILEGEVEINGQKLTKRDGLGISETDKLSVKATSDNARVLLMEVPMTL
ncbi:pirin family protein [Fulvivirga lutea]|uniref:Pirin family protein n=2 Tax=Fulvivirga lutea TaxID=2810512 RepID=A0A974WG13_9BACT|nr:pirin family protein [Fulvivirga lutea]QSE96457.1 pirin family protein [Fulvivirga lutea]